MQKHVNLVDLVKGFPTNIFLQNLASIQKRTSPIKSAHLAEESEDGSVSNPSTKVGQGASETAAASGRKAVLPHPQPLEELSVRALEWQHWSAPKLFHMSLLKYQPVLAVRYPSLQLS